MEPPFYVGNRNQRTLRVKKRRDITEAQLLLQQMAEQHSNDSQHSSIANILLYQYAQLLQSGVNTRGVETRNVSKVIQLMGIPVIFHVQISGIKKFQYLVSP